MGRYDSYTYWRLLINRIILCVLPLLLALFWVLIWYTHTDGASQGTSSTTAATLITQIRYVLNDTDATSYFSSDTELLQWINEGLTDTAVKTHCLEDIDSLSLVADTLEYALTTPSYVKINAVVYNAEDGKTVGLKKGTPAQIGMTGQDHSLAADREPEFYYEWNGKIGVYPYLAAISVTTPETVSVYVAGMPSTITSTDDIPTPAIFDNALRSFVISRAFYKDRQFQKAAQWEAKYESEVNRYRQDFIELPREVE